MAPLAGRQLKDTQKSAYPFSCGLEFSGEGIIFKLGGGQDDQKSETSKKRHGWHEGLFLFHVGSLQLRMGPLEPPPWMLLLLKDILNVRIRKGRPGSSLFLFK
jgi:hypothetical protein